MTVTLNRPITRSSVPTVDASQWQSIGSTTAGESLDDELVHVAAMAGRSIPCGVDEALARLVEGAGQSGALLLRNVTIGPLPPTPSSPSARVDKSLFTELTLLTIARRLGQPVGYVPEHGGRIVQNIVPTKADLNSQTSTSSRSNLMFHTETAFHPHRPRYLLLLCLRGDPAAHTTLVSIHDIMDRLPDRVVELMFEPKFRTSVDVSFLAGRKNVLGEPQPLVTGTRSEPTFIFDADLTVGTEKDSEQVVALLRGLIEEIKTSIVLEPGDLLVIDNNIAVHGRSPFAARFDGADRWLQRSFVVADLAPSAGERDGRVITTQFGK